MPPLRRTAAGNPLLRRSARVSPALDPDRRKVSGQFAGGDEVTTFCVAYKNELTTEWAERTGNMAGGWIRTSAFVSYTDAKQIFQSIKGDYPDTAVAIFAENGETAWYDRRPLYLHNRHILFADAPISAALGGLINARESDWF
jgi:hypothetical protein